MPALSDYATHASFAAMGSELTDGKGEEDDRHAPVNGSQWMEQMVLKTVGNWRLAVSLGRHWWQAVLGKIRHFLGKHSTEKRVFLKLVTNL